MTDLIEQMKASLEGVTDGPWFARNYPQWNGWWDVVNEYDFEVCNSSGDGGMEEPQARFIAAARTLLPEAIKEIEELRAAIQGKTFTVLSDDGEAWKARAEAAEAKANVMVADKINLRSELLSVEAKLAKAVDGLNSIASNTCCDQCQEAALVALATLAEIGETYD